MRFKRFLKLFSPPIVIELLKLLFFRNPKCFSGIYNSFDDVLDDRPWESSQWIDVSIKKLNRFINIENTNKFIPTEFFSGYTAKVCQFLNIISQKESCKILDFSGGTGLIYFIIKPYLANLKNISWHVVDGEVFTEIGKSNSLPDDPIHFRNDLPAENTSFDVIYINTSLQYFPDYKDLFLNLLKYNPKYIFLTRLLSGDIPTFVTEQNIYGNKTPCVFINIYDLINFFRDNGYEVLFKSNCSEEVLLNMYNKNIPESHRIKNSLDLVFSRIKIKSCQL